MYILDMFASGVINGERGLLIYIFTFVANGSATGTSDLLLAEMIGTHPLSQRFLHTRKVHMSGPRLLNEVHSDDSDILA